jgi:hypothetical protein
MFAVICFLVFFMVAGALALCAVWLGPIGTLCAYVLVACVALWCINPRR